MIHKPFQDGRPSMDLALSPRDENEIARRREYDREAAAARVKVKRALRVALRDAGIEGVTVR